MSVKTCQSRCLAAALLLFVSSGCDPTPQFTPSPKPAVAKAATLATDQTQTTTRTEGVTTGSTEIGQPKSPAGPSAEQLARWQILEVPPLQLLACPNTDQLHYLQNLAVSPNGKQFVLSGGKLTIWDLPELLPSADFLANSKSDDVERPIRAMAISPNGEWLAAGDQKGRLKIWTVSDRRELVSIRAHEGRVTTIAFSPNSQMVATTSYSGEVKIWQSENGEQIKNLKVSQREVVGLQFLSDVLLAAAGNEVSVWNLATGKGETVLTKGSVISPAIELSSDRRRLAYVDADSKTHLWDVEKKSSDELPVLNAPAHLIAFSHDGKQIATHSPHSGIRIWDAASGNLLQVIDADGGLTVAMAWLPQSDVLIVASELGRVRLWGTPDTARAIGVEPIPLPTAAAAQADKRKPLSSAQLQRVIDLRSLPKLPDAILQFGDFGMASYATSVSQKEAESFYRHLLGKAGWTLSNQADPSQPGLNFHKEGCELNLTFSQVAASPTERDASLHVNLHFAGNFDVRWLPRFEPIDSKSSFGSFSFASYRTKAKLTDIEVALLKQFHDGGWTAYSRLAASNSEEVDARNLSFLQKGLALTVSIGRPADAPDEFAVQIGVSVSNKSLPIPPDSGWIEFDSSTDLQLVANTKMDLNEAIQFYDQEMALDGWMARQTGRNIKDDKAWLPFIQGQRDVLVRLASRPEGGTRIIVGDAERSSWQLQKSEATAKKEQKNGLEAADFPFPPGAADTKFEIDSKQILFSSPNTTPPKLADDIADKLAALGWKREDSGITSDEYVLARFSQSKAEITLRVRAEGKKTSAMINGDGLSWSKALPTSPVRVSYQLWMQRGRKDATLDRLDEFAEEMRKIPPHPGQAR